MPYPYAAANHQRMNAREIEKLGAAIYTEDADLTGKSLINAIEGLMNNPEKLSRLQEKASMEINENPTFKILDLVLNAAGAAEHLKPDTEAL